MVFSSLTFLCIFLPILLIVTYLVKTTAARNILLVAASLLFYAFGEPVYILLIVASIFLNYAFGLRIGAARHAAQQDAGDPAAEGTGRKNGAAKRALIAAVIVNLGLLGTFKYVGWIISGLNGLFGFAIPDLHLSLPIGISFYTFQALSYIIDVYRGNARPQKRISRFFLYISFFPQLIAGPIIKYHDIEKEIADRSMNARDTAFGMRRFFFGLAKKVLISNILAAAADAVFAMNAQEMGGLAAWTGAVSYMLQIYFDFSGYSDMAIGLGQMFGFHFMENFNHPYTSVNIRDFWRRWHISLSTWFKEYLYIPLGGNRKGKARACLNKLIVFFCTGLWHGANLTFVIWGLFHGAFLLLEEALPIRKLPKVLGHIYTLLVVCVGFVIFRADTFGDAVSVIGKMFSGFPMTHLQTILSVKILTPLFLAVLVIAVFFSMDHHLTRKAVLLPGEAPVKTSGRKEIVLFIASGVLFLLCMLYLSGGGYNPFIYFRF